jgi:hypothetical protein
MILFLAGRPHVQTAAAFKFLDPGWRRTDGGFILSNRGGKKILFPDRQFPLGMTRISHEQVSSLTKFSSPAKT